MLLPAATGSGPSVALTVSTGRELTVVKAVAAVAGVVSAESMTAALLVIVVPLASELLTRTVICTEPVTPEARPPTVHVRVPPDSVPPAVADTKVVFAGTASVMTTELAEATPPLAYASV